MNAFSGIIFTILVMATLPASAAEEATLSGRVCVIDGDSIVVGGTAGPKGRCRGGVESRMQGIDAPEWNQQCQRDGAPWACGRAATDAMKSLVEGKEVACQVIDRDRYKRAIVICLAGGNDVAAEMARLGMAVAYRRYSKKYIDQEAEAKAARRGIWAGTFTAPEKFRRQKKSK